MLPRLHLITDQPVLDRASLDRILATAAAASTRGPGGLGDTAIQVRVKGATDRALASWTAELVAAVRPHGIRVIVNDRLDIALAAGADGVHLGAEDLPVAAVRSLAPTGFLVGGTCRGPEGARDARDQGADYVGLGPVYASTSKAGLPRPLGLEVLEQAARVLPTVAIGGITSTRVPDVMTTGAHGVAVIAAVWSAVDPPRAAKEIGDLVRVA